MTKVHVLPQSAVSKYPLLRPALGELCEHDIFQIERLLDSLVEMLQDEYGCTRQKAESDVGRLLAEIWLTSR